MLSSRAATVFFVLLWTTSKGEDVEVSCVFNESCVLPCSFQNGTRPVIYWFKTQGDVRVHSYFYDQDQLSDQDQDFKGRTSLFVDQISRGNASLLLREVKVQDEGTYRCFISTFNSDSKEFFINLRVSGTLSTYSEWIIIGCTVAVILIALAIAIVLWIYCRRRDQQQNRTNGAGGRQDQQEQLNRLN